MSLLLYESFDAIVTDSTIVSRSQTESEVGDNEQIEQFDKEIGVLNKSLAQLRKESSAIEAEVKVLNKKIDDVGGLKFRTQKTIVEDLTRQIDLASERITKAEVGRAKSQKDSIKLDKAIETNTTLLETSRATVDELKGAIAQGKTDSQLVKDMVEKAQDLLEERQGELKEKKAELDEGLELVNQFKAREVRIPLDWFRCRFAD